MSRELAPITPSVLAWALSDGGLTANDLARRLKVAPAVVSSWLSDEAKPSVAKLQAIAQILKRPPAFFYLPAPPPVSTERVEFRVPPEGAGRSLNSTERLRLREARRIQRGIDWVLGEQAEHTIHLPRFTRSSNPERAAAEIRQLLGVDVGTQLAWKSAAVAQLGWRHALESHGVIVMLLPLGQESARGFSHFSDRAPLIAVNTAWRHEARIFTMFHELGHLLSRTDSACVEGDVRHGHASDPVEVWCESFAAAFLLPWHDVLSVMHERGWQQGDRVTERLTKRIAKEFKVSLRAATLRLVLKGLADWALYRSIPRASEEKKDGGQPSDDPLTRPRLRLLQYGTRVGQVMTSAIRQDVLTRPEAMSYLNLGGDDLVEFMNEVSVA